MAGGQDKPPPMTLAEAAWSAQANYMAGAHARQAIRDTLNTHIADTDIHGGGEGGGEHPDLATHNTLGLATQGELDAHEAAADPHIVYQRESEKGVAGGYASLDGSGLVPDAQIPASIARDSELPDLAGHVAAGDPHTAYALDSDLNAHLTDTSDAHDASAISIEDAAGDFTATDVEGALAELQADAEAHVAAGDPHAGYRLESVDHTHASSGAQAGQVAHSALTGLTTGDDHTQYQKESEKGAASGYASLDGSTKVPIAQLPTGTTSSTVALGDAVATHASAGDPHTGYQRESEKDQASGYAGLTAGSLIAFAQLGSGSADGTKFLRDDRTWATPSSAPAPDSRLVVKELTSEFQIAATTPGKVTNLDQTLGVGTWNVTYYVRWRTSLAATGVKFDLNHSGTVTAFPWWYRQFDVSATASTAVPDQDAIQAAGHVHMGFASRAKGTAGRGVLLSADTVNADMLTIIEALVVVTVSGDLQLYFGSEATGSTQSVMPGSHLVAIKVSA